MSGELLERGPLLAEIERRIGDLDAGRGGGLFVVGEGGLGKTALLEASRRGAGERRLVEARADAIAATLPFGLAADLLSDLGVDLAAAGRHGTDPRGAALLAGLRAVEEAAATGPLILLADDLHWADADSLALLALICHRVARRPVLLLAALRPWPPAALDLVRSLAAAGDANELRLAPLSAAAAHQLMLRGGGPELDPGTESRIAQLAAGNPLLLEQALAAVGAGQLPAPGATPQRLLVSRFAGVSEAALRLARCAAVFGGSFRPALAAELAGLEAADADTALEALGRAGLVSSSATGAGFVHPLFQQELYDDIDPGLRARLHGRAFRLLSERGLDSAEAAVHAARADLHGDPEAIATLDRAGSAALAAGAPATARLHLEAAVRIAGDAAPPAMRRRLAEALLLDGAAGEALARGTELLRGADVAEGIEVRRLTGRAAFACGRLGEAAASYAAALDDCRRSGSPLGLEVALEHSTVALFAGGPAAALPLAAAARDAGDPSADPEPAAAADLAWSLDAVLCGDPAALAPGLAAAGLLIDRRCTDRAASIAFAAQAAGILESFEEAERIFAVAAGWASAAADPSIIALVASTRALTVLRRGRIGEARSLVAEALAIADLAPGAWPFAAAVDAVVAEAEGQPALHAAAAAQAAGERREWLPLLWFDLLAMRADRAAGHGARAAETAARLEKETERLGIAEPCFVPWRLEAVLAAAAAGGLDVARRLLGGLEGQAEAVPCSWPRIAARSAAAAIAEIEGDAAAAEQHHAAATELAEASPLPLEAVRTLLDQGAWQRRSGRIQEARRSLGEAARRAQELGAGGLAAGATQELHLAGGRRRRRESLELTPAEARVAELAADGLSNAEIAARLFLSPKTVDTHLQHVYAKLGINSRRELMLRTAEAPPG